MEKLIQTIVKQSKELNDKYISNKVVINYCCIFAQSQEQYEDLEGKTQEIGRIISNTKTGNLYQINPIETIAGPLRILKIRKPDITRPELGDCDFKIDDYEQVKKIVLNRDNFKLIEREKFEMLELMDKDFNVRVYYSNPPVIEQYEILDKLEILHQIEKVVYITQPSPVVLVSTRSKEGIDNVAPFGMFMNCSSKPPMIALGINNKSDTYKNIVDTKEFVVSIPNESIVDKLYKAGGKIPSGQSEFDLVGLTPYISNHIKANRIKECSINIDCILENNIETGNHNLIVGKVIGADIEEKLYDVDKVKLRLNIPRIYHITENKFLLNDKYIQVK
ncbi:MAG: flavin reductase family protein [Clostridia bacterium]